MITRGHTDTCPCYPLACPQACGAEVLRKDLTAHQGVCPLEPVACSFSDIGCMVQVPRRDLDKHIQSSMLQHMRDMALSHTATKTQLTALKQEHEALKNDSEAKMKIVGKKLLSCTFRNVSTIASQLYTLLVDTSTVEMGSTLSLALSESNTELGNHCIILEGYKFRLEWLKESNLYKISLHSVTDVSYPALSKRWRCGFNISLNNTGPVIITVMGGEVLEHAVTFKCGGWYNTAPVLHITAK